MTKIDTQVPLFYITYEKKTFVWRFNLALSKLDIFLFFSLYSSITSTKTIKKKIFYACGVGFSCSKQLFHYTYNYREFTANKRTVSVYNNDTSLLKCGNTGNYTATSGCRSEGAERKMVSRVYQSDENFHKDI